LRRKDRRNAPEPLASGTAERLAKIVEAAERAAAEVIDDAEAQARRHLEDARAEAERIVDQRLAEVSELAESLGAEVEDFQRRADRLLALLAELKSEATGAEAPRVTHLKAVSSRDLDDGRIEPPSGEPGPGTPAGARLLATQMAVSGSSREEIATRLRTGFEIEDTAPILDAILGPEE
jgi:vacuolar-type H+-ATPase subunit H